MNPPDLSLWQEWHDWIARDLQPDAAPYSRGRVLLISYQFPPVGGSGVQRPAKLAKYLRDFGWDVEVLTAAHERFPWRDDSLLADLSSGCRVHRLGGLEPACVARRAVSCLPFRSRAARQWVEDRVYWRLVGWTSRRGMGNGESWWIRPAIAAAQQLHRRHPYSALISTGPPHFVHAVALAFSRHAGVPWLADLRDPLLSDFERTPASAVQQQTQRRLERLILRHADAVITTCDALAQHLQLRYPARASAIRCIRNGFDRTDLRAHISNLRYHVAGSKGSRNHGEMSDSRSDGPTAPFTFLAAGSFYGRRELQRVLDPLAHVLARHPEWAGRVVMRLIGTIDREQRRALERSKPAWLTLGGYVNHHEAIAAALQADCSLVLVPDCSHGRMSIPAKTFELLALPRHILGLVPAGSETAQLLGNAGACTLAPLEEPSAIAAAYEQIITQHFAGALAASRDWPALEIFERREIARQFAATLDEIVPDLRRCGEHSVDAGEAGAIPDDDADAGLILDRSNRPRRIARRQPDLTRDVVEAT